MPYALKFRKGLVQMFIHLSGFLMQQIFPMKQIILISLKTLNTQLPEPENESSLFKLVNTYQIHSLQKYVKNISKMNAAFLRDAFLLLKQLLQKYLGLEKILTRKMKFD